jgi:hypothetical protein
VYGLPGNYGMFQFDLDTLPKPLHWDFDVD